MGDTASKTKAAARSRRLLSPTAPNIGPLLIFNTGRRLIARSVLINEDQEDAGWIDDVTDRS